MSISTDSDGTCAFISDAMKRMSIDQIITARKRVCEELNETIPVVERALNTIDGHLGLREMSGGEWR